MSWGAVGVAALTLLGLSVLVGLGLFALLMVGARTLHRFLHEDE